MLIECGDGDKEALDKLIPIRLRGIATAGRAFSKRERPGHTLQTTALIYVAYIRLIDQKHVRWQNRAQFFGMAGQLMRRILVDMLGASRPESAAARK